MPIARTRASFAVLALCCLGLAAGCGSAPPPVRTEYTLVQLKTGPRTGLTKEESDAVMRGHMANIERLAREGALVLAGPYGPEKSDATLRGLFVLDTADPEQARRWGESDPGVEAKVFRLEYSAMSTTSGLRAQLAADLARMDAAKAAGREVGRDGMRKYVLLTAVDADAAATALDGNPALLMFARLDGKRGFALLDAKDLHAANTIVEPLRARLGTFALDEWFATSLLVDLPKRPRE